MINNSNLIKKYREEFARQVLMFFYEDKYRYSYLSDRPDIKNDYFDIGVEVTSSIREEVRRRVAISNKIKNKEDLGLAEILEIEENDIGDDENYREIARDQSINDLSKIFEKKLENMCKDGYRLFSENNLYIESKFLSNEKIYKFINYIEERKIEEVDFDNIYIYIETSKNIVFVDIDRKKGNFAIGKLRDRNLNDIIRKTEKTIKEWIEMGGK